MIDIHCHLLPGVDDGPRNWDQALDLCRAMVDDGIRTAVATPHLIDGVYNNVRSRVEPLTRELGEKLAGAGIALTVLSGAEVDLACRMVTTPSEELPLLGGGKAVLLEMPAAVIPHAMDEILFGARSQGLLPVLAHPERNELVQGNTKLVRDWIAAGAAIQIDGDSLLDVWGRHSRRCAESLLEQGLAHAMASDAHSCAKRPPRLSQALAAAVSLVGPDATRLVQDGPSAILSGDCPPTPLYHVAKHHDASSASRANKRGGSLFERIFRRP